MNVTCPDCSRVFISDGSGERRCYECYEKSLAAPTDEVHEQPAPQSVQRRRSRRRRSRNPEAAGNLARGALLFLVGVVVTGGTYSFADVTGGTYILAWGPLLFGTFRLILGIVQYYGG